MKTAQKQRRKALPTVLILLTAYLTVMISYQIIFSDNSTIHETQTSNITETDTETDHTFLHLSGWMPDLKAHYSTQKNDNKTFMIELDHR
jgi:hypothetical protein